MSAYLNAIEAALKKANTEFEESPYKKAITSISSNPFLNEMGKEKYIRNIRRKYYYIIDEARTAIQMAYDEYINRLDAAIETAKENSFIDSDAVIRLSSELITVSDNEFYELARKYKNNYSMQEVLANYAKQHKLSYDCEYIPRYEKVRLAEEIRDKAIHKLDDIGYIPLYILISEELKKILVE